MLEGKNLILATKPFAVENPGRSRLELLLTILLLAGWHALFWVLPLAGQIVLCPLLGLTIVRLFVLYHDYLHKAILKNDPWANYFFTFFGLSILVPPSIWKRSHDYHHKHNSKLYSSSIGSYPIVTREKFESSSKSEQRIYLFIRHPLTIMFGYIFTFLYGMSIRSLTRNPKLHYDSLFAIILHFSIAFAFFYFGGWAALFLGWIIPNMIAGAIGSYLFYAQHNFPNVSFADKDGWTYVKASMDSSSYMKMNPVMCWFTANIGYHHIHHLNARIPFYRLPEAFESLKELQKAKVTSLSPMEIYRCLQLKVYDPDRQRMLTTKELRREKAA